VTEGHFNVASESVLHIVSLNPDVYSWVYRYLNSCQTSAVIVYRFCALLTRLAASIVYHTI
jgi:hypothetical protein